MSNVGIFCRCFSFSEQQDLHGSEYIPNLEIEFTSSSMVHFCHPPVLFDWLRSHFSFLPHCERWRRTEGKGPVFTRPAMRAGLCCACETMGADGRPAADVARPVTDACERAHPPMESISAAWQGLTHTDGADLESETETHTLVAIMSDICGQMQRCVA